MVGTKPLFTISAVFLWVIVTCTHEKDFITKFTQQQYSNRADAKGGHVKDLLTLERETLTDSWKTAFSFPSHYNDPDANRNLTELILSQGYLSEKYTVQTDDGFLLDLHRIPNGRQGATWSRKGQGQNKPVVYLQHALLSSACDWVMNFAEGSLGFILADAGYDVWMGNSRGNTYSRRHVSLEPDDEKFWDWSFDEMARYDLPAFLDFVLNKTGSTSLYYIGHSQGTTMAFALFSQRPDIGQKIRLFVALAPVTQITHTESPIKYLASLPDDVIYDIVGKKEFLPSSMFLKLFADLMCKNPLTRWVCYNTMFLFVGFDLSNLNQTRMTVYMHHSPAGASVKDMVHFAQLYKEKKFIMYDYGSSLENVKHYNQSYPPEYNLKNMKVPVVSFTGTNDWLSDPQDAATLLNSLPNLKARYEIQGWNHMDFVWGLDAANLCYATIIQWLEEINSL